MQNNFFPIKESYRWWIPDPLKSETDSIRFSHNDLGDLDNIDLEAELSFLFTIRFMFVLKNTWETERIIRLKQEISKRKNISNNNRSIKKLRTRLREPIYREFEDLWK